MITPIIETKKTGRNEPCHCESGKKYKHCCLEIDERKENPKTLNQAGMLAVFRKLIKDSGGKYNITYKDLAQIPPNEGIQTAYDPVTDSFDMVIVKIQQRKIIIPDKRIKLAGN